MNTTGSRLSARLSQNEAWRFINRSHTAILTSLRSDGRPVALPVWFIEKDREISVRTLAGSKKVARIRNDPRVSLLTEEGYHWSELRAVHLHGVAHVSEDPGDLDRLETAIENKYGRYTTPPEDMPDRTRKHYEAEHAVVTITPTSPLIGWDNRRLKAERRGGNR